MINCIKSLRKVNKDTQCKFAIIKVLGNITCTAILLAQLSYLFESEIDFCEGDIHEIFIQTIIYNMFKHFRKNWKNRSWSVVFNIFLITFFKNWNNFCNFKFFRKDCFFKRCFKNFEENDLHRIVDIHNNITAVTIATNDLVSFEIFECFFEFLKRNFFMIHQSIALR